MSGMIVIEIKSTIVLLLSLHATKLLFKMLICHVPGMDGKLNPNFIMPSVHGQSPSPSEKVLGSYCQYLFTSLWAPSQQPPSLAFCSNTRHKTSSPKPSRSKISLEFLQTPTHSAIHSWGWNHCIGECQLRTLSILLSKSFLSPLHYCLSWVLERWMLNKYTYIEYTVE